MLQQTANEAYARPRLIFAAAVVVLLMTAPASAQVQVQIFPSDMSWGVGPPFSNQQNAGSNISGTACTSIPARACLAVNDSSNFAQFFAVGARRIRPTDLIPLQPNQVGQFMFSSVGAEGAAFDGDRFYVIGSRGQASPATERADFLAFRFKFDAAGPPVPPTLPEVERSDRLREAITAAVQAGQFGPSLQSPNNVGIEGVAVRDGRMFIGLRTPSPANGPFIMSVGAEAVFGTGNLNFGVRALNLGAGIGIRDMATISTGILILTGPSADVAAAPSLFHLTLGTGMVSKLGDIVEPTDRKAEALLVLQEDPEFIRFLVMFDGIENGGPIEYFVPR
jgi:hypothetical protein